MSGFAGQAVLITGAGGGIGRALVAYFAARGARVLAHDRDEAALAPLRAERPDVSILTADLRDAAAVRTAVAGVGPVDVLVNNAGAALGKTFKTTDEAAFNADVDVNFKGTYHAIAAVTPGMIERGRGAIVTVGTVNALGSFGHPVYGAAKAGLVSLTRSLAVELGRHGIRVNIVCPGTVRTPAWEDRIAADPGVLDAVRVHYPLGRIAEPADVAEVVGFLASDAARIVTGAMLAADCGLTAGQPALVHAFTLEDV